MLDNFTLFSLTALPRAVSERTLDYMYYNPSFSGRYCQKKCAKCDTSMKFGTMVLQNSGAGQPKLFSSRWPP